MSEQLALLDGVLPDKPTRTKGKGKQKGISYSKKESERNKNDAYYTPEWCANLIAETIRWKPGSTVLEPCSGGGAIENAIRPHVTRVDTCDIQRGVDFLTHDFGNAHYDFIVTNPPFKLARQFAEKSIALADCVVFLLKLNFLATKGRKAFFQKHPVSGLWVLTRRPKFTDEGSDYAEYGLFVWDKTNTQGPRPGEPGQWFEWL